MTYFLFGVSAKHLSDDVSTTVSQKDTTGSATLMSGKTKCTGQLHSIPVLVGAYSTFQPSPIFMAACTFYQHKDDHILTKSQTCLSLLLNVINNLGLNLFIYTIHVIQGRKNNAIEH